MSEARLWDISPPLRGGMPVWPGDTPFTAERTWQIDETCPVNVSRVTFSTHSGSHADAPLHYDATGQPVGGLDLERYIGPCRVIDVRGCGARVETADIEPACVPGLQRLLLRTRDKAAQEVWDPDFKAVAPEAIAWLAARGVLLVGVDTPSLDPQDSKSMEAHGEIRRAGMSILEGLVLDAVAAGDYELMAPPLKLVDLDAAPLRAVLRGPLT